MNAAATILIVCAEPQLRCVLEEGLACCGHHVEAIATRAEIPGALARESFDVALVSDELPAAAAADDVKQIRGGNARTAVLVLARPGREHERSRCFEAGCDDYLVKPFTFAELRGRLAAVLRRLELHARGR